MRLYAGVICAILVAICAAVSVAFDAWEPLRVVFGGLLVLWAPGFALTAALFVAGTLGGAERAALSFATSLALTMIPAVILEAAGVRLGTTSFLITACAATWLAASVALVRLPRLVEMPAIPRRPRPRLASIVAAIGLCAVLAGAVLAARITPQPAGITGSSAFAAVSAAPQSVVVEVISAELEVTNYRVAVLTRSAPVELARFSLRPGGTWRRALDPPSGSGRTELFLYRASDRLPYRRIVVSRAPA